MISRRLALSTLASLAFALSGLTAAPLAGRR
jgi:hypothetical protein